VIAQYVAAVVFLEDAKRILESHCAEKGTPGTD
jgi:hypothetical protein